MKCFLITGMPATGKTFYSDKLLLALKNIGYNIYHIYGDAIAHISFNCKYTKKELDVKYDNIMQLIKNAFIYNYDILIIDDLIKRETDYEKIKNITKNLHLIYLQCDTETLLQRNQKRSKYHRLSDERLTKYINEYQYIIREINKNIVIDVGQYNKKKCYSVIIEYIKKHLD